MKREQTNIVRFKTTHLLHRVIYPVLHIEMTFTMWTYCTEMMDPGSLYSDDTMCQVNHW